MNLRRVFGVFSLLLCVAVLALAGLHQGLSFNTVSIASLLGLAGTVAAIPVEATNSWKTWNIKALDSDTTTSFPHGFGLMPDAAWVQAAASTSTTLVNSWGLTVDATNITLTKLSAAGSGGPVPGTSIAAKVFCWLPHSASR